MRWPGFGPVGGFAEFIPVPGRYLIRVSDKLQFEQLAPLTDAGLTPYRGIKKLRNSGALGPDRVVGVFGIGGLGGYAVQYAKILGSGATVVAFARNLDVSKELSKATGQKDLDAIIDCAGARR